ncbi:MAG TPA: glycosyltransferase family 39 protein [Anaerolineae bacterium]
MRSLRLEPRLVLLFAFSAFALAPLTAPGYFIYGHDARHSVYFLQMFDLSMRDGAWYPRWATDMVFGYGYPLWLILAPLPFFIGQAFHLLGFDFVSAVKLVDGLALFFSSLTMYLYASRVLNKNAALVAAVAYAYVPYHLIDLYVRSAQAELVSFVFPPLVLWAFHQLAVTRQTRYVPIAALSYAGLVLAHISMAVIFTPIIGLYLILLFYSARSTHSHWRFALDSFGAIALALGIAAVFLLPVLAEQKYLTSDPLIGGFFNYRKHFVSASQLLSPFWGYGYAGENGNDQFSLQLGLVPVLLAGVGLWAWKVVDRTIRWHMAFFALVVAALVLAMLPVSAGLWEPFAAVVAFVQFPWRLLIVAGFALAFLCGTAVYSLVEGERDFLPALVIALMFVVAGYKYTEPQHTEAVFNYQTQMEFEVKDRELLGDTIWMTGERPQDSPLVEQYLRGEALQKAIALDDGVRVEMLKHGGQSEEIHVQAASPARVMFYTRYFPGWVAAIDGKTQPLEPYGDQGLILVNVPAGSHVVRIRYEGTTLQQAGAIISGLCFLAALAWIVKSSV